MARDPDYFDDEGIKRLNDAINKSETEQERIDSISSLLNLTEEDKKMLYFFPTHFRDLLHPFNEEDINSDFREEMKIAGTERLFLDLEYRQRIADIYDNYLKP